MSNKEPVLLLDLDGILADFNLYSIQTYNRIHSAGLDESNINKYIGNHEVIDPKIDAKALRKPFKEPGAFINLPIIEGAQEGVRRLQQKFLIYILSSPYYGNPTCVYEKDTWLQRHFPTLANHCIYTSHKEMIMGDVLVDDRPENLLAWKRANPGGMTATLEYPWSIKPITDIVEPTWEQLADRILGALNEKDISR